MSALSSSSVSLRSVRRASGVAESDSLVLRDFLGGGYFAKISDCDKKKKKMRVE